MPRTARSIEAGTIHHVLNRGKGRASNSPSAIPARRGRRNKISDVPFSSLGGVAGLFEEIGQGEVVRRKARGNSRKRILC